MSNEGRICPQCSYQRQPKDLAPDYECPRCGIIYHKYRPPEPKPVPEESRPDEGTPEEDEEWKLRPASPLRRALAGIYTGSLVALYFVPVKLFVYATFRLAHPPESIQSLADIEKLHTWEIGYYIYLGLLIIYAFFIRPFLDGATWGQEKFGVVLRPKDDPEGSPTFKDYVLRFAGKFSTARQYETGEPLKLRQALNKAFMPACFVIILQIAVVGPLSLLIMKGYLERPRQSQQKTAKQLNDEKVADVLQQQMHLMRAGQPGEPEAAPPQPDAQGGPAPEAMSTPGPGGPAKVSLRPRQAVGRQSNIRSILTTMEKRHLLDRGSYTEDLEALVANYSTDPNERDELLKLVMQGALRARKTVAGVEIWQQNPNGEWVYEEVRR
jgi:hypothetical protein